MTETAKEKLTEAYYDLIKAREELMELATEREQETNPLHSAAETKAEADGILRAIQVVEDVLNEMEDNE